MNWHTILNWAFYILAAFLFSWYLINVYGYWGDPAAYGYFAAAVWLLLSVVMHRLNTEQSQLTKSALAGWQETLNSNESLLRMVAGLKQDLKQKDEQLAQKIVYIKTKNAEVKGPTKGSKAKNTNVKRRGKLRR